MKKSITFLSSVMVLFSLVSLTSTKTDIPPGTFEVSSCFFADMTEVRNIDWLEYTLWTERIYGNESNEYKLVLPDETVWEQENLDAKQQNYFRHPEYSDYPVVGISYEQAKQYCKWRSDRVNELIWIKRTGKDSDYIKNFDYNYEELPKVFEYRLPSQEEWIFISQNKYVKDIDKETKHLSYPASSSAKKGFYRLNNNVSEMTSEKGIAMGGNWKTSDNYNVFKYQGAMNTIGFRCVCDKK